MKFEDLPTHVNPTVETVTEEQFRDLFVLDELAYKVVSFMWPKMDRDSKAWALDNANYGDTWGAVDTALLYAAEHSIPVPLELLDAVDEENAREGDIMTMRRTVPALRKLAETEDAE